MLDAVRYMVVWNPIILTGLHFTLLAFGVKPHEHHHAAALFPLNGTMALNGMMALNGTAVLNGTAASLFTSQLANATLA